MYIARPLIARTVLFVFLFASSALAQPPDVSWVFGNFSSSSYSLDSFSPPGANLGALSALNPTLNVVIGRRYQVTVTNFSFHPFEVIAKSSDPSKDTVLLSAAPGRTTSWESNSGIAWTDNGAGTTTFTLTLDLYNAMLAPGNAPGYRCAAHITSMRGDFNVSGVPINDPIPAPIAKGLLTIELEPVIQGLAAPVHLESSPDNTNRLFVVDQPGLVWILKNDTLLPQPFLDVTASIVSPLGIIGSHNESDYDERGLLGLAFHPAFTDPASPGYRKLYTYTSEPVSGPADFSASPIDPPAVYNHQSVIAEWSVDPLNPDRVDPAARREILRIDQPQFNHNGGMIAFARDNYLYIALGDGGAANDSAPGHGPTGNGQNIETPHGSILRIDPLDPALTASSTDPVSANSAYRIPAENPFVASPGIDEIYAYGFRNPYRFSFDKLTSDLIVGDVGQNFVEEVDIIRIGGNYGWNLKEGTFRFDPVTGTVNADLDSLPPGLIDPVLQYDHDEGISIIGGYAYRGAQLPELFGKYVFGDFSTGFFTPAGRLFHADLDTGLIREFNIGTEDRSLGLFVKGFGQDADGEIYLLASSNLGPFGTGGVVLKIVDICTENLPGDINHDCLVNITDFALLAADWLNCTHRNNALCTN
jgi:glucose/arabinose dehydrogenase